MAPSLTKDQRKRIARRNRAEIAWWGRRQSVARELLAIREGDRLAAGEFLDSSPVVVTDRFSARRPDVRELRLNELRAGGATNLESLACALGVQSKSLRAARKSFPPLDEAVRRWLAGERNTFAFWSLFQLYEGARYYKVRAIPHTRGTALGRFIPQPPR